MHQSLNSVPVKHAVAVIDDFASIFEEGYPIFVLIDPMLGEPLPEADTGDAANAAAARALAWGRDITPIGLHPATALPQHQHPYMVALKGKDDPLIATTLSLAHDERTLRMERGLDGDGGAAHHIGGWIQSSMHPDELALHLSTMLRVRTDARTSATYMRLMDRRVLDLLCNVAGSTRVAAQLGRLRSWSWVTPTGRLATLRSESEAVTPLLLDKLEWEQMGQGAAVHRTMKQMLGELHKSRAALPMDERGVYSSIRTALAAAAQAAQRWPHRFLTLQDTTTWAALTLLCPATTTLPAIAALMDATGSADNPAEPLMYLHRQVSELARVSELRQA